ncbi:TIM44-like domain-containing protein [Terrihabitans sp. B22-R8]|uniref:TIM44-like domain-containing protein n=1 Tax=Terrihabitans sp. B22-R8 TaxID=3425128 RepID=UPI00403C2530
MSRSTRLLTLIAATAALIVVTGDYADARMGRGGSFGSRGARTFQAPPATPTAPRQAQPIERSTTQPGAMQSGSAAQRGAAAQAQPRRGLFGGGLAGGLMGGLLGAGLFGLLMGNGFFGGLGGLASIFGLLLQVGLIVLAVRLVMGWFRRRREQPAFAAAAGNPGSTRASSAHPQNLGMARDAGGFAFGSSARDFTVSEADQEEFGRLLIETQEAYGREDLGKLRALVTPEMLSFISEDLADNASKGVINELGDVALLQGDVAEAWREDGAEYASAAMRFQMRDVMRDRASNAIVDGDSAQPVEVTEVWTFRRVPAGKWTVSAIQQG